ncbi:MAG: indolepyruvate ferredoxin oxidoreductase subunit alpha [Clostridiales Family XIII bacterium]|jgi:indolepyruvate ferredoxin oxidoreductase alpha subunit|nr:indolepyruvate ferredoxin oxidoreductase subunit alpha [Clostridiales Family XIII bacterium]
MGEKLLLTGDEAVARGAWEAGLEFASAYPGTPSTEILENLALYKPDVYAEWAPNEKVALESAIGASLAGVRALAAMKHVGVNVAADPLFTFSYTGVTGGMVLVSADDPGLHSSQNEQDNRNYAQAAKVLMLEPADSAECLAFTKLAFGLSERFDTPVLLRMTTRVCHSKSLVETGERVTVPAVPYEKKIQKYVMTPANARVRRAFLVDRYKDELAFAEKEALEAGINRIEWGTPAEGSERVGVVSAGVAYQYAKEVFGEEASYLKLGITWPMPVETVRDFASKVDKLYVVEEVDPYMEDRIKAAGIDCIGKAVIPEWDELNTDIVRKSVTGEAAATLTSELAPVPRPPALCAGCPHRGLFYALSKRKDIIITGDIGCYTLGSAPPLSAMHTTFCMGGSISTGHGASKALAKSGSDLKIVAVIGDSTFFHTGVNSLMNVTYNSSKIVAVILDNRITAMTGQQENPGTGYTLQGDVAPEIDIPKLVEAIGIKKENIWTVNPLKLDETNAAIDAALAADGPAVVVTKWPCVLKKLTGEDVDRYKALGTKCYVDQELCKNCKICTKTGCVAIYNSDHVEINEEMCTGCTLCAQTCPFDAIKER